MPPRPRTGALVDHIVHSATFSPIVQRGAPPICSPCLRTSQSVPASLYRRSFSSTAPAAGRTRLRRKMFEWLNASGSRFRDPENGPTYLHARSTDPGGDAEVEALLQELESLPKDEEEQDTTVTSRGRRSGDADGSANSGEIEIATYGKPFPNNEVFLSQSVLSEDHKDAIWKAITEEGKSIREVSVDLGIEMNRIAAVLRLKGVEKRWADKRKPLANAYAKAIMKMLPVTSMGTPHETINDLPLHRATKEQIFWPTSESRVFTRADAGAVFDRDLLSVDERVPHPQLVQMHRDLNSNDRQVSNPEAVQERLKQYYADETKRRQDRANRQQEHKKRNETVVESARATFRFKNVVVDEHTVGKDGRGRAGVGARYGVPHEDRKKGQVKIPTRVGVDV